MGIFRQEEPGIQDFIDAEREFLPPDILKILEKIAEIQEGFRRKAASMHRLNPRGWGWSKLGELQGEEGISHRIEVIPTEGPITAKEEKIGEGMLKKRRLIETRQIFYYLELISERVKRKLGFKVEEYRVTLTIGPKRIGRDYTPFTNRDFFQLERTVDTTKGTSKMIATSENLDGAPKPTTSLISQQGEIEPITLDDVTILDLLTEFLERLQKAAEYHEIEAVPTAGEDHTEEPSPREGEAAPVTT